MSHMISALSARPGEKIGTEYQTSEASNEMYDLILCADPNHGDEKSTWLGHWNDGPIETEEKD